MRTNYRNGDDITLHNCGCDGCSPGMVNGVLCHEYGCPDQWRDYTINCRGCDYEFFPQDKHMAICPNCAIEFWRTD